MPPVTGALPARGYTHQRPPPADPATAPSHPSHRPPRSPAPEYRRPTGPARPPQGRTHRPRTATGSYPRGMGYCTENYSLVVFCKAMSGVSPAHNIGPTVGACGDLRDHTVGTHNATSKARAGGAPGSRSKVITGQLTRRRCRYRGRRLAVGRNTNHLGVLTSFRRWSWGLSARLGARPASSDGEGHRLLLGWPAF